ncbi:MAG TPA: hypothetical protein VI547_04030, partial [Anaerolineales bacterium]|nr:hypothetical protein [Anaerolineales bacterium]
LNLLNSLLRTLASISINGFGDFIPRHNIPWRAVYDIFLSALFWLGTIALVSRWRSRSSALLLAWAGMMLLPVILTMEKNSPHFTRMQGTLPALAGICAAGGLTLFEVIARRNRIAAFGFLGVGLAFSLTVSTYDYFVRWANDPALFDAFQVGDWRAANFALQRSESQIVFLSPELLTDPAHAAFDVLLKDSSVRNFPGPDCLAYFDRPARPLTFVIDAINDKRTFDRVHALFPAGREGDTIYHEPDPWPLYQIFEVQSGAAATPPTYSSSATFGGEIKLIGYEVSPESPQPGETVTLALYWQALRSLDADYSAFIHLYSANDVNTSLAQNDGPPCNGQYTTSRWEADEIVIDERTLILPPDFAGPTATLGVGLYAWPSLERLAVTDSVSALPDNRLLLAEIQITH